MKKFLEHEYDDIGRIYVFDDGSRYYSVTTALGYTKDNKSLEQWKAKVGKEKAEAICKVACETGTSMHEVLEYYMLKKDIGKPVPRYIQNLANQIIPYIDKRVSKVYRAEAELFSDKMGIAGTADGIVQYGKTLVILDFKTAKRQPKVEWIQDYLLQLALYALMWEEIHGERINYGVLLFAYKAVRSPKKEIIIKLDKYKEIALKRVDAFHEKINKINKYSNK